MSEEAKTEAERRETTPPVYHVDGHNLVLPFWLEVAQKNSGIKSLLVHIDAHADMDGGAPTLEKAQAENPWLGLSDYNRAYAANCLSVASHTIVGCFKEAIGSVIWFDPRKNDAAVYGSFSTAETNEHPPIEVRDGRIYWQTGIIPPPNLSEPVEQTLVRIKRSKFPIVLDIDLDAFLCVHDPVGQDDNQALTNRLKFVDTLLRFVPRENIRAITIARSQTPSCWVPRNKVGLLLTQTVGLLEKHS